MNGLSVEGSDISRELLMSNLALENGWDLSLYDPSNTSWVVGWFVPTLARFLGWAYDICGSIVLSLFPYVANSEVIRIPETALVYKIVLPMIFAFTPVLLYLIFRKQIGELKAFYASVFFIIVPVYALEICTIGKSMVAETLMVLTFWVLFNASINNNLRTILVLVLILLTLWAHYTIGILLCIYLGGIGVYWAIMAIKDKANSNSYIANTFAMVLILLFAGLSFYVYYSNVAQGLIWNSSTGILHYDFSQSANVIQKSLDGNATASVDISATVKAYNLVKSALGLDLFQYSWSGIAFRVVQLLTQLLIVLGFGWMIWKRNYPQNGILAYRWNPEFVAGCFVAFGLLGLCVVVPAFASLINATRQYHLALFFLSPMFVIAFDAIGVCLKWSVK
jgi:uncharacterized membrane protein